MIHQIFIAPRCGEPMLALTAVEAITECGLRGDRHAHPAHHQAPENQLTLIELEHIQAFSQASGLALTPDQPRRNLVTLGVDLNALCGKRFRIGEVALEGLELCEPCATFASEPTLRWCGSLHTRAACAPESFTVASSGSGMP